MIFFHGAFENAKSDTRKKYTLVTDLFLIAVFEKI